MKIRTLLAPVLAVLLTQVIAVNAADWYTATVRGTCKYFDGSDHPARRPFNNNTLIAAYIATQPEPPLARHLKVAYDPESDKISIVNTNGESVLDLFAFGSATVAANSTDTQRERQVFLFEGTESEATGSAIVSERITRDGENVVTKFSAVGTFQFSNVATAETVAEVCSGTFTVGKKLKIAPPPAPAPEP